MADQSGEGGAVAPPPTDWGKNLRCCMVCRLMKTFEQFYDAGCENCPFLSMDGDRERIFDCTSTEFQGMVAVVDPKTSWCAKWTHLRKFVPGCYALAAPTELPQHIEDVLDNNNITWHKRDQ